jgi:hypothetical protein
MSRCVVVLSPGGKPFPRLVAAMEARGTRPHAVVLYPESVMMAIRGLPAGGRLRALLLAPLRRVRVHLRLRALARSLRGAVPVVATGSLNGARMERDLRTLAPDVVVLAGCRLLADNILAVPREGTVNVHPALLPWVRGNSPLEHSLLRRVPLGCSAFWVDPGIDTGRILERRLVPLAGGETLQELRGGIGRLWAEMTAGLVAAAAAGPLPAGTAQPGRFPLCRTLRDPEALAAVAQAVARGEAGALLDGWRPLCDPRDLSLPPGAEAPLPLTAAIAAAPGSVPR